MNRFYFFILFLIVVICVLSVILVDSLTGAVLTSPGCQSGCTPVFYRTLDEKAAVEKMWYDAGFVIMGYGPSPSSFRRNDYLEFACACPRAMQELGQPNLWSRPRVVTVGSSV